MTAPLCNIEDCESKHFQKGWCTKHYKRWVRHGDPRAEVRPYVRGPQQCSTEGCANPKGEKTGGGLCSTCYWREYRMKNRARLDNNYKAWRVRKGSRWATMPEPQREAYRANAAKRRAARKGVEPLIVTERDLARLRLRQNNACAYCQRVRFLTLDHIIPLAAGGRHSIGNLALACEQCNKSKGSAVVTEWRYAQSMGVPIPYRRYADKDGLELAA